MLHHALECCADRRSAVREMYRVLRPGGRLLICAFNPFSLWGVRRLVARLFDDAFSDVRFVSPWRLLDWMAVLGFEVDEGVRYLMYRPPLDIGSFESPTVVAGARRARARTGAARRRVLRCSLARPRSALTRSARTASLRQQTSLRWSSLTRRCAIRRDVFATTSAL